MDKLYDDDFINSLPDLVAWENPYVVGICKFEHSRPLMVSVEEWYSKLPEYIRHRFKTKLRSKDSAEFMAGYYELTVHQYCLEEGWSIEYEPEVLPGKTPDFIVTTKSREKFVLEVATIFDSDTQEKLNRSQDELNKSLSAVETDYNLSLHYSGLVPYKFDGRRLTKDVDKWLKSLSAEQKTKGKKTFKEPDFQLTIEAEKQGYKGNNGAVVSIFGGVSSVPNYSNRIKDIIEKKNKKYSSKKTGLPFIVVAASGKGLLTTDWRAVEKALYGEDMIVFDQVNGSKWEKTRSGLFTPKQENGQIVGKTTGVGAVLFVKHHGGYENGHNNFEMKVFHNPLAHKSINEDLFSMLPQFIAEKFNDVELTMKWTNENYEDHRIGFKLPEEEK